MGLAHRCQENMTGCASPIRFFPPQRQAYLLRPLIPALPFPHAARSVHPLAYSLYAADARLYTPLLILYKLLALIRTAMNRYRVVVEIHRPSPTASYWPCAYSP